jgi:hypothetical protein
MCYYSTELPVAAARLHNVQAHKTLTTALHVRQYYHTACVLGYLLL